MNVRKKRLNLEKIIIDIVLCPKTSSYLQSFFCHKCTYFNSDERNHISCNYRNLQIKYADKKKEELINIFSKIKGKNEISSHHLVDKEKNHDFISDMETLKVDLIKELKKRNTCMMT
ncbi:MAG: hypothetical protein ACTSQ1_11550 [Promethearchaeota archaeon]